MRAICLMLMMVLSQNLLAFEMDDSSQLNADGGQLRLHTFYPLLEKYGITVEDSIVDRQLDWEQNAHISRIKPLGGLQLYAPYGGLKAVTGGQLHLATDFAWILADGRRIEFKDLQAKPTSQPLKSGDLTTLDLYNSEGQVVFTLDHIHAGFAAGRTHLFMENMDWRISPWLAKHISLPELAHHVIGQANMEVMISIPADYRPKAALGGCSAGDNWPPGNPDVDVALIDMQEAAYLDDVGDDHIIITPSATLESVGTADVAWYRKFTGDFDPYNNDQHPYLIWNLYREIDGRFEQIGMSGVKHAFFTVNTVCPCAGGQVLFPTCQDKYSISNNNAPSHLGPRDNIEAYTGLWESTGSFFDQNGDGVQDTTSNGLGQNRLVAAEADLNHPQAEYYLSAWYLIRDDINIHNSMGHKQYSIAPNGNAWLVTALTPFISGPASDQYVSPNTVDLPAGTASQRLHQNGEGHLTVAVKVEEKGVGSYRYNYMIENHDYDPQIQTITIPFPDVGQYSNWVFSDVDEDLVNDWTVSAANGQLMLQAPAGNEIDWGTLYAFSFTTDLPPVLGDVVLTGLENGGNEFSSQVIVPSFSDLIFATAFE
ncbi:hypothetical protein [Marinicella meishanensis]|uniref:hypothetical protein n=1 Tax=Marinicella meishanensis TaxID=2873263 RepID=UPI001CBC8651|nr:hypothetical protein [Marinicella sp. NBU2979]